MVNGRGRKVKGSGRGRRKGKGRGTREGENVKAKRWRGGKVEGKGERWRVIAMVKVEDGGKGRR